MPKEAKVPLGVCGVCGRRRQLGRCAFAEGRADLVEHCRACCTSPVEDRWAPIAGEVKGKPGAARARKR